MSKPRNAGQTSAPASSVEPPSAVDFGKDELNLAEFPFAVIAKRLTPGQKTIRVVQEGRDELGRPIRQEWVATAGDAYGLPIGSDEEVYVALMKLLRDSRFASQTVRFTLHGLLKIMKAGRGKLQYERVRDALRRLTGVAIYSENAFWDNARRRLISSDGFHILESYRLTSRESPGDLCEVKFSEFLFNNMQAGYVKNLDVEFYFTLSTALARRLYRLLDKHRYRGRIYETEIFRLAHKIPLQDAYPSQIQRRLDPVFEELHSRGFLDSATYRQNTAGETILRIEFTLAEKLLALPPETQIEREPLPSTPKEKPSPAIRMAKPTPDPPKTLPADPIAQPTPHPEPDPLVMRLEAAGVSHKIAQELTKQHAAADIERQLEYLPFVEGLKNPGGYLRKAVAEGYGPPQGLLEKERKAKEKERVLARVAAVEKKEAVVDDLLPGRELLNNLNAAEREALIARAEAEIRAASRVWREMRKILPPQLENQACRILMAEAAKNGANSGG